MPRTGKGKQAVKVATGQEYGEAQRQTEAQKVIPLPQQQPLQSRSVPPGSLPPLVGPSQRPTEPVTAGLPIGEGPGPEIMDVQLPGSAELAQLKGLFARFPSEDLRRLIERAERGAYV